MINPKLWGKPGWNVLEYLFKKQQYILIIDICRILLPCEKCKKHFSDYYDDYTDEFIVFWKKYKKILNAKPINPSKEDFNLFTSVMYLSHPNMSTTEFKIFKKYINVIYNINLNNKNEILIKCFDIINKYSNIPICDKNCYENNNYFKFFLFIIIIIIVFLIIIFVIMVLYYYYKNYKF